MKSNALLCAVFATSLLVGCGDKKAGEDSAKPADSSKSSTKGAPSGSASSGTASSAAAPPGSAQKLDSAALDKVADAITFTQASEKDGTFSGKLQNTSTHTIGGLEYDAFAYGKDGKLLERIEGKYPSDFAAGKSVDIQVGPFKTAKGKDGVTVELVVSWMNVDGTSFQRPVPKDRAKGGPNNALKR